MAHTPCIVVDTIVQLSRLIPVVNARCIVEAVITRSLSGFLDIWLHLTMIEIEIWREALTRTIIEIVLRVKTHLWIVFLTQILHTLRLANAMILTGHMIGHEINDDLHACLVRTLYQLFKLQHTLVDIHCQIRVYIIIVSDGVWRTRLPFNDSRMILRNTIGSIIGLGCMTDDTRIPDMAHAHVPDVFQGRGREVVHLSAAVLFNRSTLFASSVAITIETGENLIDNNFIRCHELQPHY